MSKEYLAYWGFKKDPFHLAPDNQMMYMGGQYYECYERLLYAVNTNKGGVLIVSEEAGLGKTTILLKLASEMKENYADAFRYAFIEHPTLSMNQIMSVITDGLVHSRRIDDKLSNLTRIRQGLTKLKAVGGKAVIIVDEAHMLTERADVLQELRILLNLTSQNEYLFTMILSGQKPLWNAIRSIPELWQRLPVRYYLVPLRFGETRELINCRIKMAGFEEARELFTVDAVDVIHRFSKGLPRTIISLCDLSLLIGASNHARKIGFKEVSKVIQAMAGQGEHDGLRSLAGESAEKKAEAESFLRGLIRKIKG
jgi:type II secretory pathway predicted ATPase ExeA